MHMALSKPINKLCAFDSYDNSEDPKNVSQKESKSSKNLIVWKPSNNINFNEKPNLIFKSFIDRMEYYENIKKYINYHANYG